MAVMPLVPETKMADVRKQSVSGTHWPKIFYEYFLFTFSLTGPTHSLQCDFQREHSHSHFNSRQYTATKMYTPCNHSLTCYTFSVRFFSSFKNRNFVKLPKERKKQHGRRYIPPNIHY